MARLNSTFNYKYQVEGETIWGRLNILDGFIEGRKRALALREKNKLETEALGEELEDSKTNKPSWEYKRLLAKKVEWDSVQEQLNKDFELAEIELKELKELYKNLELQAESTRLTHTDGTPYTNYEMYEANAEFEFVAGLTKEVQAQILVSGRPSVATVRNLLRCPMGQIVASALPNLNINDMFLLTGIMTTPKNLIGENKDDIIYIEK
jgi:hypothetical protein